MRLQVPIMNVKEMSRDECVAVVVQNHGGVLACVNDNRPYMVPVHYVCDGKLIYCFSMPGQKTDWLRLNSNACFLVEKIEGDRRWTTVLVRGTYSEFTNDPRYPEERDHAWSLLQKRPDWWEPGAYRARPDVNDTKDSPIFYSISIDEISGRRATADS